MKKIMLLIVLLTFISTSLYAGNDTGSGNKINEQEDQTTQSFFDELGSLWEQFLSYF